MTIAQANEIHHPNSTDQITLPTVNSPGIYEFRESEKARYICTRCMLDLLGRLIKLLHHLRAFVKGTVPNDQLELAIKDRISPNAVFPLLDSENLIQLLMSALQGALFIATRRAIYQACMRGVVSRSFARTRLCARH